MSEQPRKWDLPWMPLKEAHDEIGMHAAFAAGRRFSPKARLVVVVRDKEGGGYECRAEELSAYLALRMKKAARRMAPEVETSPELEDTPAGSVPVAFCTLRRYRDLKVV